MRKFAVAIAVVGIALCASSARAEEVDNPTYKQWAKFKVGSFVMTKTETEAAGNKTEMETTQTLVELTKDKAVVEIKTTMHMGANKFDTPATKQEYPAKVKKAEGGKGAEAKTKESKDTVDVGGKKMECKVVESDVESGGMKTHSKVWMCDQIPGGVAKMESHTEGAMKSTMKQEVVKFEAK